MIHFRKARQVIIFIVSGPSGRDNDSQNQYYLSLETPGHSQIIQRQLPNIFFEIIILGNLNISEIESFENRKDSRVVDES